MNLSDFLSSSPSPESSSPSTPRSPERIGLSRVPLAPPRGLTPAPRRREALPPTFPTAPKPKQKEKIDRLQRVFALVVMVGLVALGVFAYQNRDAIAGVLLNVGINVTGSTLQNGLVGLWSFNGPDTTDKIYDRSGQNNNGYFIGGATTTAKVAGKIGQALTFDGVNDYVNVPSQSSIDFGASQDFTISVWVKTTQAGVAGQYPMIVNKMEGFGGPPQFGYEISLHSQDTDPTWAMEICSSGSCSVVHSEQDIADGTWHHIVAMRSGSTVSLYQDGGFVRSTSASAGTLANVQPLNIGRETDGSQYYFNGSTDELRIYNRALSIAEVKQLYMNGGGVPQIKIGYNVIGSSDDTNSANNMIAQQATTSQTTTIATISFYIATAAGNLRLGLYDATGSGGKPGALLASTTEITPVVGWNTVPVIKQITLPAGTYWLAWLESNNGMHQKRDGGTGSITFYYSYAYGLMPNTFDTSSLTTANASWSLYATMNTGMSGAPVSMNHSQNVIPGSTLQNGLVGEWSFNGLDMNWTANKALDRSGQGNDGTLVDMATSTAATIGKVGQALLFDGGNDRIHVPDTAVLKYTGGDMTLSAWIYPNTTEADEGYIFSKPFNSSGHYNYRFSYQDPDNFPADVGTISLTLMTANASTYYLESSHNVSKGAWHHVVATIASDKTVKLYIDGALDTQGSHSISTWTPDTGGDNNDALTLGYVFDYAPGEGPNTTHGFDGKLDEMRMYNRVLSAAEVRQLYAAGGGVPSVAMGVTGIGGGDDTNSANNMIAQPATTTQTATLQSLSFYVATAAGQLRLGVYDSTGPGGGPGNKLAETAEITPGVGWNTVPVVSQVSLPAGTYWLAWLENNNGMHQRKVAGRTVYYAYTYGPMPATFSPSPTFSENSYWSLYANLSTIFSGGAATLNASQNNKNTSGLVGQWSFNGPDMNWTANKALDRSGNGNDGVLTNMATKTAPTIGKIGQALKFDGVNDYVNVGSPASLDNIGNGTNGNGLTVSAWIFPRSDGQNAGGTIVGKGATGPTNGWYFAFSQTGLHGLVFIVDYDSGDLTKRCSGTPLSLNAWSHVMLTWDGSTNASNAHIYINGLECASYDVNNNGVTTRQPDESTEFSIGNLSDVNRTFDGTLDEVRVYNRILPAAEVRQLYNQGR